MKHSSLLVLSTGIIALALPLAGCGDFGADETGDGDGDMGTGGGDAGTGGSDAGTGGGDAGTGGGDAGTGGSTTEDAPDASCDNVVGCGGDVTGVWFAVDSCLTVSGPADLSSLGLGESCSGETSGTLEVSGNWTIDAESIITDTTQTTGTITLELQPDCKEVSGTVTACDAIGGPLAGLGFSETTCVDSTTVTDGCTCTGTVNQAGSPGFITAQPLSEALVTPEGNSMTFAGAGDDVVFDYCVDGNFAHVTPTSASVTGQVSGTIVFQKQP